jgi:hypothetical protein
MINSVVSKTNQHLSNYSCAGIKVLYFTLVVLTMTHTVALGAIIFRTYDLANYSSDQEGAVLSGSFDLLIDTANGGVIDQGSGNYLLLPSAVNIVSWNFSVNKPGETPYSASSTDPNHFTQVSGSAFFSRPDNFSISSSTDLTIGINDPLLSQTFVSWNRIGNNYASAFQGNVSPRGWDTSNPTNIDLDSNSSWIVGVPEPTTISLILIGGLTLLVTRRREKSN